MFMTDCVTYIAEDSKQCLHEATAAHFIGRNCVLILEDDY